MATRTIRLKRSGIEGKIPETGDLELGEAAVNFFDGKMFFKKEADFQQSIVEFVSSIPIKNAIFVQKDGSDDYAGSSWDRAVASIEKALELAWARDDLTLIDIGPGVYETQGNLDMPDNCVIRCVHRTVVIRPIAGFEVNNVFRMGSGCFIEGPLFEDWQLDSLDNPTKGFAISFRPGAVIRRVPYAHKIAVRTTPHWGSVAPPLDRKNGNPLVGNGAGVVLADGAVCSPYSIFPNIMTWGATPVTHNGVGYCAKNGGLVNAVNTVSIWAHKHFLALNGGHIILSSCSTQFGDYTLVSEGKRQIVVPGEVGVELVIDQTSAAAIEAAAADIVNDTWNSLVTNSYTTGWTAEDEEYARSEFATLLQSIDWVLQTANEKPMLDFAKGLYDTIGELVIDPGKVDAFEYAFNYIRDEINLLSTMSAAAQIIVTALISELNSTMRTPEMRADPSTITAIGHTWSAIFAGVALTKIPPASNIANIQESIQEIDQGLVIASGQDDQGSALFVGGLEISADTGELSGPPFDQAVNRIATRAAIARSF